LDIKFHPVSISFPLSFGALSTTNSFGQPFLLHLMTLGKINVQLLDSNCDCAVHLF